MWNWEVLYVAVYTRGDTYSRETGWLVVDALSEMDARMEAVVIVTECYNSDHPNLDNLQVEITECRKVARLAAVVAG